ncbi:hypothetical protein A6R68_01362 [Neotoma lepida]|uniref:Uncharacterized protein n=1 Tax=Neotoma lepida TaxID=56216 RepID=A0A1A6GV93_NEOLE|nr:hypothetical protein A6R68_01362 [Neotoma lepida]
MALHYASKYNVDETQLKMGSQKTIKELEPQLFLETSEIELAKQITSYEEPSPGFEHYASKQLAVASEAITQALSENASIKANDIISKVCTVNQKGNKNDGLYLKNEVLL